MNQQNSLISTANSAGWIPVRDYTRALIESQCPSCRKQMPAFHRYRLDKKRVLSCSCGYRRCVNEDEYEAITCLCFTCGKEGCCANDHRFIGLTPAGSGL